MKAIWNDELIAERNDMIVFEGNYYFPKNTINKKYFKNSDTQTVCPWKGTSSSYSLKVDVDLNKDAAWYYPETSEIAKPIKGYIAFWKGVKVIK